MKYFLILGILLLGCGLAQAQCGIGGVGAVGGVGQVQCGLGFIVAGLENSYCAKGSAPEMTEGTPTWGATDDVATMPTKCIYTGMDATPSFGNTYTPGSSATFAAVLASANGGPPVNSDGTVSGSPAMHMTCGDIVTLTAGTTYTGEYSFPTLACDGAHWIRIQTSGVTNPLFPGEGVRATPCIAGLSNDGINGRIVPGYPDYVCASFGSTLSAKILQPANDNSSAASFVSGANHYRFIGIEFAKSATNSVAKIVKLQADGLTLGANHVIFDRYIIHGTQWTPAVSQSAEATVGISAKNSQWISEINGWNYDTYCNASCIDSQAFAAGTGLFQDGPFKLYNNLLASSGETIMFGGGGQGSGTPNTQDFEIRGNHSFKPLTWMVPIAKCADTWAVTPKNLFELKNGMRGLVEANVFENVWQGCQSDQNGTAYKLNPSNQNNHIVVAVAFSGTNLVSTTGNFTHHTTSSPLSGNPVDAANCPPGGCVLNDITNSTTASNLDYHFCDGLNGCDQSGVANLKCGTGTKAGQSCTTDGQCTSGDGTPSYCAPTTNARIACGLPGELACPAASSVSANSCVPGDCPDCKVRDITTRFNEIYNTTGGIVVNTGLSSICHDQASGMRNASIHDNHMHGISRDMSNGVDPYSDATAFSLSNNAVPPAVVSFVTIRHNTVAIENAIENGTPSSTGSFGNQIDHSDIQYIEGVAVTDNISPGGYAMSRSAGTGVTKGIGGASGLAFEYAVNSCQRYFTNEALTGTITIAGTQNFTFAGLPGGGTNYMASFNGQYTAITAPTATSFTVTVATKQGDTIVVRDLNDCNWTFSSNLIGIGQSGVTGIAPNFFGAGLDQSPYPNPNSCGAGNSQSCILNETGTQGIFINNFVSWLTGRDGNYAIKSNSGFFNTASDALSRASTGKSPGADFVLLAAKTAGVRGVTVYPALSITTANLSGTHCAVVAGCGAMNSSLVASFGASQFWAGYKGWFLETAASLCAGACGAINNGTTHSGLVIARDGTVNGPISILNVSRTGCPAACVSTYVVSTTIVGGAWEINQIVSMAQFLDCTTGCTAQNTHDSSFNGVCQITALVGNGFSCRQAGDIAGTNSNTATHNPYSPKNCGIKGTAFCDSTASFAPISVGTYTFWVGTRDGAFQVARRQIVATIN